MLEGITGLLNRTLGSVGRFFENTSNPEPERGSKAETDPLNASFIMTTGDLDFVLKAMDSVEPLSDAEKDLLKAKLDTLGLLGKNNVPIPKHYQDIVDRLVTLSERKRSHKINQMELQLNAQILREDLLGKAKITESEATGLKEVLKAKRLKNSVLIEDILKKGLDEEELLLDKERRLALDKVRKAVESQGAIVQNGSPGRVSSFGRLDVDKAWEDYISKLQKIRKRKEALKGNVPGGKSLTEFLNDHLTSGEGELLSGKKKLQGKMEKYQQKSADRSEKRMEKFEKSIER